MRLLRRIRTDEAGFSLPELLTAMIIGTIVLVALMTFMTTGFTKSAEVADRSEAAASGRTAMDRMVTLLDSSICLDPINAVNAIPPLIGGSDGNTASFYADLDGVSNNPDKYLLSYDATAKTLTEQRYDSGGTLPNITFPTSPSRTRVLASNVIPERSGSTQLPIFRYFDYETDGTIDMTSPMTTPVAQANANTAVRVLISFQVTPSRTSAENRTATNIDGQSALGTPDSLTAHGRSVPVRRLRDRLRRDESGFTMVAVITGMVVIGMFALGAYQAALGDISVGRKDQDRKRALEAAKAGIEFYAYHLYRDSNYWTYCNDTSRVASPGISLQGMNRPAASYRQIPGSDEQFQVELMSADGNSMTQAQCLADPGAKMLNSGVLRIRSTGQSHGITRQVVATFRRNTFLDYLWYTNWETSAPAAPDDPTNAATDCDQPRTARRASGTSCAEIVFGDDDMLGGPMHTEDDSFLICSTPTFGRTSADNLEVARATAPSSAYKASSSRGCSSSQTTQGTTIAPSKSLDLPPDNQDLAAGANFTVTGQSCATFNSNGTVTLRQGMTWDGAIDCDNGGTVSTQTLLPNTVIYAKNGTGGCPNGYKKIQEYPNTNSSCGDIAVRGTYGANVTVGAADDIVVRNDLQKPSGGNQMMGLIANNFVRLYHPAYKDYPAPINRNDVCQDGRAVPNTGSGSDNGSGRANPAQNTTTIANNSSINNLDAAVLALNGSFITDNWACGALLGNLNLTGNIAQYWRGAVGTQTPTGYNKNYTYDDRLKYRQPPSYLDPQKAAWHLLRQSEQSPVK